ncbi:MAG: M48 family metallopeptidase [Parachlamydiaceae bacterium]
MITHILFFILLLILIALSPIESPSYSSLDAFFILGLYFFLLTTIFLQNKIKKKWFRQSGFFDVLAQVEFIFFLATAYFLLHLNGLLFNLLHSFFLVALFPIVLFLLTNAFYHFYSFEHPFHSGAWKYTKRQINTLIPFTLPFLIFALLNDLVVFLPIHAAYQELINLSVTALFLITCLPPFICYLWDCSPLKHPLKAQLELLCQKAHFEHGGLKSWNQIALTPTAAILGVWPRFRYILFTPSLLNGLSSTAVEAVLAHEIGHSKHKHLLFFPFVLGGMIIICGAIFEILVRLLPVLNQSFFIYLVYVILIALYFRLILGFFSRLFERQADLYGLKLGIPLSAMIEALDSIGRLTGNSHKVPNWHHFSLEERIIFLKKVEQNPLLEKEYDRYVFCIKLSFITFLTIISIGYFFKAW